MSDEKSSHLSYCIHDIAMADRREQYLWDLFQRVDTDRSGSISVHELQTALVNGDWSPFNIETVRMMVNIFDTGK